MALSMPLNGLKEEDKEPLIELFVKVSAQRPERRGLVSPPHPKRPHAASPRPEAAPYPPHPFPLSRLRAFPPRSGTLADPAGAATERRLRRAGRAAWVLSPSSPCPTPPRREPQLGPPG